MGIQQPSTASATSLCYLGRGGSLDIGKTRRELGYEPVISLEEGPVDLRPTQQR